MSRVDHTRPSAPPLFLSELTTDNKVCYLGLEVFLTGTVYNSRLQKRKCLHGYPSSRSCLWVGPYVLNHGPFRVHLVYSTSRMDPSHTGLYSIRHMDESRTSSTVDLRQTIVKGNGPLVQGGILHQDPVT